MTSRGSVEGRQDCVLYPQRYSSGEVVLELWAGNERVIVVLSSEESLAVARALSSVFLRGVVRASAPLRDGREFSVWFADYRTEAEGADIEAGQRIWDFVVSGVLYRGTIDVAGLRDIAGCLLGDRKMVS